MTEKSRRARSFFILVPGPWDDVTQVLQALENHGLHARLPRARLEPNDVVVDLIEDDHLAAGFAWGRQGPLPSAVVDEVADHTHAALVECAFLLDEDPARVAAIGRALRQAGGVAVRMEASGSAWDWDRWLARLDSGLALDLYEIGVINVHGAGGVFFTCGMHQVDLPDAQISDLEPRDAIAWLDAFNLWQLLEAPVLASGHTFRPHAKTTRRALERWPDPRHRSNDGRLNPFGQWRILPPGEKAVQTGDRIPFILPSLASTLLAIEVRHGHPLDKGRVEAIAMDAPSIEMEIRDAIAMERSRGYADIEPELAWEQWQIIRNR